MGDAPDNLVVGDVVVLKSGGHEMTIEKIEGGDLHCIWSDGKRTRRETFRRELLCDKKRVNTFQICFTPSEKDIDEAVQDLCKLQPDEMTRELLREILRRHFMPESQY